MDAGMSFPMSDTLTRETFDNLIGSLPKVALPWRLIEVQSIPIYGQARRHRKRRIDKKWRKRYGMKIIGYERHLGDQILVDERNGNAYCHPDVAARARKRMEGRG